MTVDGKRDELAYRIENAHEVLLAVREPRGLVPTHEILYPEDRAVIVTALRSPPVPSVGEGQWVSDKEYWEAGTPSPVIEGLRKALSDLLDDKSTTYAVRAAKARRVLAALPQHGWQDIASAVLEEREACAKVAEAEWWAKFRVAKEIAAAIRSRSTTKDL